jgi:glycerol-3-phosphate dehydrogenase (NAD(P)+)
MANIVVIGAGMMGTALCVPLMDRGHRVRLVGTPLDGEIISSLREKLYHPTLKRNIPSEIQIFSHDELENALEGVDCIASGVSSFGVEWFAQNVGPYLKKEVPVIAVTKGLQDLPDGNLITLPEVTERLLPGDLQGKISLNAIGGPCIAGELAARRQTCVVFCGKDLEILKQLAAWFSTSYYHIGISNDLTGVEVCAALKNGYAMGVSLAVGMMEKIGLDGSAHMYNPQAALFGQACREMRKLIAALGGGVENISWLPGAGDLFVTVFGGRTRLLGSLLGQGLSFKEARARLSGITLESVEIIRNVTAALPKLAERGVLNLDDFPLIRFLAGILFGDTTLDELPWDRFSLADLPTPNR